MSLNPFASRSLGFKIILMNLGIIAVIAVMCQVYLMPQIADRMIKDRQALIRVSIETARGTFEAFEKRVKDGTMTAEQAKEGAKHAIDGMRYNEKEYFFLLNTDGIMVNHPIATKLNGTSVLEMKDPNGLQLFAKMIEMAKKDGEGYLNYLWPKPGSEKPVEKISFVKLFAPWGWILGTGLYNDDVQAEIRSFNSTIWWGLGGLTFVMSILSFLFAHSISRGVSKVSDGIAVRAEELKHISDKLNVQSQSLSTSTVQSSAAIQQTSASLTEITSMITRTSQHVGNLLKLSGDFEEQVAAAGGKIDLMAGSMGHIEGKSLEFSEQADSSLQELRQIEDLFKRISDKTKLINDIVFQTKLLSFNASVEAARAGESGKGFAVVAQEIGSLAEMSGRSSLEISEILSESNVRIESIIKSNQERTGRMVSDISEALQEGAASARTCKESFVTIVQGTRSMGSMVTEISHASSEQSSGVSEITKAIGNLDQATQENASIAQAASSEAAELLEEAQGLHADAQKMAQLIKGA